MKKIELKWKDFNINLSLINNKIKLDYPSYKGNQAYSLLELWFDEVSDEEVEAIKSYWDSITEGSEEATSYKSGEQVIQEAQESKQELVESAKTKLATLGLSEAEISAILGV